LIAAVLAPLLSILIFVGSSFTLIALQRKRLAAFLSHFAEINNQQNCLLYRLLGKGISNVPLP